MKHIEYDEKHQVFVDNPSNSAFHYLRNLSGITAEAISNAQGGWGRWSRNSHNNNACWARKFEHEDICTVIHGSFSENENYCYSFIRSKYKHDTVGLNRLHEIVKEEIEASSLEIEKQRELATKEAVEYIARLYTAKTSEDGVFPYLANKGISSNYGALLDKEEERLVIPLYDKSNNLTSYQYIKFDDNEEKKYKKKLAKDCTKKGSFFTIGNLKESGPVYVAEGFATACSIHEATGNTTIVAVDCGNLLPVVESLIYHDITPINAARICIVADNDNNQAGENHAKEAADKTGCSYVLIPRTADEPSGFDANDFCQKYGPEKLKALIEPRRDIVGIEDFCSHDKPASWLVDGYFPSGPSVGMIYGTAASRKTFLTLDLALHVCFGLPTWFNRAVKQQPVLYLGAEGIPDLRKRIKAWCKEHNKSLEGMNQLAMFLEYPDNCRIDDNEGLKNLWQKVPEGFAPGLIVCDTLAQFLEGDENKQQDAANFVRGLSKMSRFGNGATVIFIHHTSKGESGEYRGSTVLKGNVDFAFPVSINDGISTLGGTGQEKLRQRIVPPPISFNIKDILLDDTLDEHGNPVTKGVVVQAETEAKPVAIWKKKENDLDWLTTVIENTKRIQEADTGKEYYFTTSDLENLKNLNIITLSKDDKTLDGIHRIGRLIAHDCIICLDKRNKDKTFVLTSEGERLINMFANTAEAADYVKPF